MSEPTSPYIFHLTDSVIDWLTEEAARRSTTLNRSVSLDDVVTMLVASAAIMSKPDRNKMRQAAVAMHQTLGRGRTSTHLDAVGTDRPKASIETLRRTDGRTKS